MKLRVAMLSKWHVHAKDYARELNLFDDVDITAVWDEDAQRGAEWAKELGVDFEADLNKLLTRGDVDAVVVDTPTCDHEKVMIAAAKAGKHIFTEKALAITIEGANQIAKAVKESGVKFCISYPQRTTPKILYAKKVVSEGLLGKISLLRIRNAHSGASDNWLPAYWYDAEKSGGGAMMDLGCHPNYQAAFLLGKPKRVAAMFNSLVCPPEVEDNAVSVFEFENGAMAILETGFVTPFSPYRMEILGTEGTLIINDDEVSLRYKSMPESGWLYPDGSALPQSLPAALRQWVDGILKDTPIVFGIEDAVALTEMMDYAYRSHREQKIMPIE